MSLGVAMVDSGTTPEDLAQQREQFGARTRQYFERLIGPLREVARAHGYALAVHGSINRDIDLIACPWTADAADHLALCEALMRKCAELLYGTVELPWNRDVVARKPHGRLCAVIHLGGGPYIDLSVMPRAAAAAP